jgi:peptide/nickel transport system substrate-binding protein
MARWRKRLDCFVALLLAMTVWVMPARAADPKDCGTIVLPTGVGVTSSADITSFSPLFGTSLYNEQAASFLFMGLIWLDADRQIDWSRSLASSITTPDQGLTYLVTLRPWHWSDGVPVTTADVTYTFQLIKEMGTTYPGYGSGGMPYIIKSLDVIDATHFRVVLTHRVNSLWYTYNGLAQLSPLPRHAWSRYTMDQIYQAQSTPSFYNVVDGPLKIQRLDVGLDAIFVPNPAYEGPKMHFDRLIFRFLESDGAALQAVESGDLDLADLPNALWSTANHLPGIYDVNLAPSSGWNEIQLNFRNPQTAFLKDVRVRQAIQDAINQPAMVKLVFHGAGVPIYGPLPPLPANFLSPALRAGQYPVGFDPAKARALLAQAGYTPGPDGIMQKDGKPLAFTTLMSTGDADITQMTEIIQSNLRQVGIDMKVRQIEFNQLLALLFGPPDGWQTALVGETVGAYPSGESSYATGAGENSGGYSDAKMDALIDDSMNQPGLDSLYTYEDYAMAQQPVITFAEADVTILARDRIHGVQKFVDSEANYYPEQLYCSGGST